MKSTVILFLLLIFSLLAAAYCFIQSNISASNNQSVQRTVMQMKLLSQQLLLEQALESGGNENEIASGDALIEQLMQKGLSNNDGRVLSSASVDQEFKAVLPAWRQYKQSLDASSVPAAKKSNVMGGEDLDTLEELVDSLAAWLDKMASPAEEQRLVHAVAWRIQLLKDSIDQFKDDIKVGNIPDELSAHWQSLATELNALQNLSDPDAKILHQEANQEYRSLTENLELLAGRAHSQDQISLSTQSVRANELQLLLDKLGAAIEVLDQEHEYLFRLGIVAALISFLLLFILAIVFWRDSQQQVSHETSKNAENQKAILLLLDEMTMLAEGDLTMHATVSEDITGAIADAVNYAIDALRTLVLTINNTSIRVAKTAEDTGAIASRLSRASTLQEREVRRSSNYITAMSNTMKQMSVQASAAADVAAQTLKQAQAGSLAVTETGTAMVNVRGQIQDTSKRLKRLGESSQQIGEIVGLVNEIADRTNLLALNAALQASGGDSRGRGFEMVAEEVQKLAERVSASTREVESLITTMQADTSAAIASMELSTTGVVNGAALAEQAGVALEQIKLVSHQMSEKVSVIADKSSRQAEVTSKLSGNMKVISDIALQTDEGMKTMAESVDDLSTMSQELTQVASGFILPEDSLSATGRMLESDLTSENHDLLGDEDEESSTATQSNG